MTRNGLIPPLPRGVDGNGLQVEFISILAQAQKAVATVGIERMCSARLPSTAISFGIDHRRTLAVEGHGRAGRGLSNLSCPPIQAERCIRVHLVRACPPVLP
jgi:hypothetical protein